MNWLKKKYNVYVVCTANITRSPYFAAVLQRFLRNGDKSISQQIVVYSSGTHALKGRPVDVGIKLIASQQGMNLSRHTSRVFTHVDAQKADLVLTMDEVQKRDILIKYPELGGRVYMVLEYGSNGRDLACLDILDPTGREPDRYRQFCRIADEESIRVGQVLLEILVTA